MSQASNHELVVLQQKIIDKQVAYLILNGTKKTWIKLHEAGDAQTAAIMKFQTDRNNGIQPNYYPEAENHNGQIGRIIQNEGEIQSKTQVSIFSNIRVEYNLRSRQLCFISKFDFYGNDTKQAKKENMLNQSKTKKQIKKQEHKQKYKRQLQQQQISKLSALENNQQMNKIEFLENVDKKIERQSERKKKIPVIDIGKTAKRKIIKKQQHVKLERNKMIQIYDGSDSELKMM